MNILSKVLEKHISSLVQDHLEEHHPLSDCQWGCRPGRSTVTALLSTTHCWFQDLDSGKEISATFLDFKKAFDSVPHAPLIEKLQGTGLHPQLLKWLTDYLSSRKQQIVVNGESSSRCSVSSGVPQGSVLGPLLFAFYIDDITKTLLSPGSTLVLYVDDVLLYNTISVPQDFLHVQSDLDSLHQWSVANHLALNPQKCKTMILSRK